MSVMDELFQRISGLAMVIGVLTCFGSFAVLAISGGNPFTNFIFWILSILFGISLISMGSTRVIKEHEFYQFMRDFSKKLEIKKN